MSRGSVRTSRVPLLCGGEIFVVTPIRRPKRFVVTAIEACPKRFVVTVVEACPKRFPLQPFTTHTQLKTQPSLTTPLPE